jgi:transposase
MYFVVFLKIIKKDTTMKNPTEELFKQALGLESPYEVVKIKFSSSDKRLDIYLDFPRGSVFRCPECGRAEVKAYDTEDKTWRHLNFFQHQAYLHCRVPRIDCPKCGIKQVKISWARPGSGFTLLFESLIMMLAREMPVLAIAELIDEHDTKIWRVIQHYVEEARRHEYYGEVTKVGVDETSRQKRHKYVTIFADLEQSKVIFVTEGNESSTIGEFINDFRRHGGYPDSISDFCCDMWPAFISGIELNLPDAEITFDHFHVMKMINDAVDKVRRNEQKQDLSLKHTRYIWLKNPSNLTVKQKRKLESLSTLNLKTARAYRIKLALQEFYTLPPDKAEAYLKRWYFWVTHSRLEPMIEAAKMIKRHWQGVVNFTLSHLSNGVLEAINGLVQAARARARGYRSTAYFITMIYLIAGKLNI